jgi:hypothetical protein
MHELLRMLMGYVRYDRLLALSVLLVVFDISGSSYLSACTSSRQIGRFWYSVVDT